MTGRLPKQLRTRAADEARVSAHDAFVAEVESGPIVDNAGQLTVIGELEYDGPRCIVDGCDSAVDNDREMCEPCGDSPHDFHHIGLAAWPDWCACGRIRSVAGYSPVHGTVEFEESAP